MEPLYNILNIFTNIIVIENLTYKQALDWIEQNGDIVSHILIEQENL